MDLGVIFDLRNPPGWRQDWNRVYGFTLEMCQEAERAGLNSAWFSEHHLFEDGYLTQPLTFMAAAATVTSTIRLGTGILIGPFRSAVQIAEEATVVDILSNGRVELGLGAGYRLPEYELFGADLEVRYRTNDSRITELREIFADERHQPSPMNGQIPLFLGYQGPKGARRAGRLGAGLLSARGELWEPYREGLIEGGHDPSSGRMKGNLAGWATDDPEKDWPVVAEHLRYQLDSYRRYMVEGTDTPVPRPIDPERARAKGPGSTLNSFTYGTPEDLAAAIVDMVGDAPVEEVSLFASIAGMPEQMVADHIALLGSRLKPLLAGLG